MVSKERNPGTSDGDNLHPDRLTCVRRHTRVLKKLKQAIKQHLKKFSSGGEMWYKVYECIHHNKDEDLYIKIKDEVQIHLIEDILSYFKSVEDRRLLSEFLQKLELLKPIIGDFSDLFKLFDVSKENDKNYGLKEPSLKIIKEEVLFKREFVENLRSALEKATDEPNKNNQSDSTNEQLTFKVSKKHNYNGSF